MVVSCHLQELIQRKGVLWGFAVDSASPTVAEMAGMIGYDILWVDLEHGNVGPREAELFCVGAKAGGGLPLLRIQSADRTHVLHALEAGARLVVVPMVNNPETARQIVEHGKYAPCGNRGFHGGMRGLRFGIGDKLEAMQWADRETALFVQIETVEAVNRCADIVAVEGIAGALVGPADLSVSMGKPLAFDDPEVLTLLRQALIEIRAAGKIAATVASHPALLRVALDAGVQIVICASETSSLRTQLEQQLREATALLRSAAVRG